MDPRLPGLMSDPDTAGLDPIFWLHHANIDRLWEVWRRTSPSHLDPTEPDWLTGPARTGERTFSMPMPDGRVWNFTPADVAILAALEYDYDDLAPGVAVAGPVDRLTRLAPQGTAPGFEGIEIVTSNKNVELVGANQQSLRVVGSEAKTSVDIDKDVRQRVSSSLESAARTAEPDRVFLNLENVRGLADSTAFQVFISARGAAADSPLEQLAGSVALFGVRKATEADGPHAGQGLTFVLEITDIIDELHLGGAFDVDAIDVRIVPVKPVAEEAEITIGRISIFRQGRDQNSR